MLHATRRNQRNLGSMRSVFSIKLAINISDRGYFVKIHFEKLKVSLAIHFFLNRKPQHFMVEHSSFLVQLSHFFFNPKHFSIEARLSLITHLLFQHLPESQSSPLEQPSHSPFNLPLLKHFLIDALPRTHLPLMHFFEEHCLSAVQSVHNLRGKHLSKEACVPFTHFFLVQIPDKHSVFLVQASHSPFAPPRKHLGELAAFPFTHLPFSQAKERHCHFLRQFLHSARRHFLRDAVVEKRQRPFLQSLVEQSLEDEHLRHSLTNLHRSKESTDPSVHLPPKQVPCTHSLLEEQESHSALPAGVLHLRMEEMLEGKTHFPLKQKRVEHSELLEQVEHSSRSPQRMSEALLPSVQIPPQHLR